MDIVIRQYTSSKEMAVLFPPLPPVSLNVDEYLRTDYINHNEHGLLAGIQETPFKSIEGVDHDRAVTTVCGIFTHNQAIDALLRAYGQLRAEHSLGELYKMEMPAWTVPYGLQPYYETTNDQHSLRGQSEILDINQLPRSIKALDAALNRLIEIVGTEAFALKRDDKKTLKIVILTDLGLARMLSCETKKNEYIGAVVSSANNRIRGQVYLTLALFDEDGRVDSTASFGNLLYTPTRFRTAPSDIFIGKNEDISTVYTKIIATLPFLSVLYL